MFEITSYLIRKKGGVQTRMGALSPTDQSAFRLPDGSVVLVDSYQDWEYGGQSGHGFESLRRAVEAVERERLMALHTVEQGRRQSAQDAERRKKLKAAQRFQDGVTVLWQGMVRAMDLDTVGELVFRSTDMGRIEAKVYDLDATFDTSDGSIEILCIGKMFRGPAAFSATRRHLEKYGEWV
jgi:hypothetical protein